MSTTNRVEIASGLGEILISEDQIRKRVEELGRQITQDYRDTVPLFVCVLRGAVIFHSDLIRQVDLPLKMDFISVSSYGSTTESSGEVRLLKDLESGIRGQDVILVEDIIDTGLTVDYLLRLLRSRAPASLEVCALLSKPSRRKVSVSVRYIGFEIPDQFVVGYGLDLDQRYRNLPYIAVADPVTEPP